MKALISLVSAVALASTVSIAWASGTSSKDAMKCKVTQCKDFLTDTEFKPCDAEDRQDIRLAHLNSQENVEWQEPGFTMKNGSRMSQTDGLVFDFSDGCQRDTFTFYRGALEELQSGKVSNIIGSLARGFNYSDGYHHSFIKTLQCHLD